MRAAFVIPLALLIASDAGQRQEPSQLHAGKLVLPATTAARPAAKPAKTPPPLSRNLTRQLALEAGMPPALALDGAPVSLSARRLYVEGVAYLAAEYEAQFDTRPDAERLEIKGYHFLTIHFRTASDNAFVLIAVHGAMKYGSATTAELYGNTSDPNAPPKPASAPVGPVIPFAVACAKAGWHTVQFRISGVGLAFEIARVDLSLFSS